MPIEYKPCPFCGSSNIEYNNDTGSCDEAFWEWISCVDCGAKCHDKATWNSRPINRNLITDTCPVHYPKLKCAWIYNVNCPATPCVNIRNHPSIND